MAGEPDGALLKLDGAAVQAWLQTEPQQVTQPVCALMRPAKQLSGNLAADLPSKKR